MRVRFRVLTSTAVRVGPGVEGRGYWKRGGGS